MGALKANSNGTLAANTDGDLTTDCCCDECDWEGTTQPDTLAITGVTGNLDDCSLCSDQVSDPWDQTVTKTSSMSYSLYYEVPGGGGPGHSWLGKSFESAQVRLVDPVFCVWELVITCEDTGPGGAASVLSFGGRKSGGNTGAGTYTIYTPLGSACGGVTSITLA